MMSLRTSVMVLLVLGTGSVAACNGSSNSQASGGQASGVGGNGNHSSPPTPCATDSTCTNPTPYCGSSGLCVACLSTANCGNGRICDTTTGDCVQCTSNSDCGPTRPYCAANDTC